MKIVFFSGDMSRSGGTERVLSLIANGLVDRGYEIVIFSLAGNGPSFFELDKRIRLRWVGSKGLQTNIISNFKKLITFMHEERPDFLIDVDIILCFYSGILKLKFPRTHWISWEHFNYYYQFPVNHNLRKIVRLIVTRFSECLVVLSDEDKRYYQKNLKLRCRIERIYNPTPFEESTKKETEEKIVLAVGRLEKIKGFDMLINCWKPIEKRHNDWKLQFLGSGSEEQALKAQVKRLGLKNVEFVGRVGDVTPYYKKAAIFALPSRNEGFVMVLLEAMAYYLPAVAFSCKAGVSEVIKDGINGYLVPPNNMKAFAQKMNLMIGNKEERQLMGKNASELIKRFARKNILDEWEELFSSFA